jgi:acyl-[acyl-carrier-protein]-phospholipid O-acyltransferase/long-chain-fatty-acid--[acyl-carrier-protein] ligase
MQTSDSASVNLPSQFIAMCRRSMNRPKLADSTGQEMTGGQLLLRTLILRRLLRREVLSDDERYVGILLPPTNAGVLANAALSIDCRVSVNLNYTTSSDVMNDCLKQCGIRHVITSRRVLEKLRERFTIELNAEIVFLEDLKDKVGLVDKAVAAAQAYTMPEAMLKRRLGLDRVKPDDLLTVIFTSGATGQPKGVMLSHRNVGSNVEAVDAIMHLGDDDVLLGVLPFFHSFGYTTTLWTVLTLGPKGIYHYTPLEAREVGKMARRHGATILIATPTFLRSYLRRCEKEDFAKLQVVVAGAEKMPIELAEAFEKTFGVRPIEGYGATELSPIVSGNIPPARTRGNERKGIREGTVGQPLPGIHAKVVDLDTGEDLGVDRSGMLLISGPNVMIGYFGRPELTAEVIRDGWYVTGDVATIDADGFITITGRLARFSKLGGEMVPHLRIEEALTHVLEIPEDELRLVVTAVPDERKGERLVVLHTGLKQPPEDICRQLQAGGLPPLWTPSADSFRQVESIPVLGTGKLDLKRVKEQAAELFRDRQ